MWAISPEDSIDGVSRDDDHPDFDASLPATRAEKSGTAWLFLARRGAEQSGRYSGNGKLNFPVIY